MEARVTRAPLLLLLGLVLLLRLPFLNQAIQGDDHIYLAEAEHDLWIPRMRAILGGEAFPPFDREGSIRGWGKDSLETLLDEFERRRTASLRDFAAIGLADSDLSRTGKHPEFGTVTLSQLLSTWTAHDLIHLSQITRTMARRYRDAVGPWRAYIKTLQ